jgi:hypothetical protein
MAKSLTTNSMISSIFRRGMIPENQNTFTDDDIIEMINEELQIHLLPVIMKVHEEYYVISSDVSLVSGTSRYQIPYRAIGNKLRDVHYKNESGDLYEMTRISPDNKSEKNRIYTTNYFGQFYLEGNEIVLLSNVNQNTGSIQMSYWLRPNDLVANERAGQITAIDRNTGIITLSTFPSHFSDLTTMDFVGAKSPNKILGFDIQPSSSNSTIKTMTFDADDIPTNLVVGDYLLKAEETIIPNMPSELIPILMQRVAIKCLEALGDTEALKNAKSDLQEMEFNVNSLIDNRVEGAPIKVNNRYSILGNSSSRYYRRRY